VNHLQDPNRDVRAASIRTVGFHGKKKHIAILNSLYDPINSDDIEESIEMLNKPTKDRKKKTWH
jgi:subtilase family serine protease